MKQVELKKCELEYRGRSTLIALRGILVPQDSTARKKSTIFIGIFQKKHKALDLNLEVRNQVSCSGRTRV